MVGALIAYLIGRKSKTARDYFADFVGISEFVLVVVLFVLVLNGAEFALDCPGVFIRGIHLKMDGFRALYSGIAILMWMMTTIFSKEYFAHYRNRNRYYFFLLLTFGGTVGVFLSADLFTTFIFFEIMSMASYVMVIHDEKPGAMRAGDTYLCVAVLGGMVMLMGMFLLYNCLGTLNMDEILVAAEHFENKGLLYLAGAFLLFGFGAKAGMFPIHVWLPKAHPVAPAPASALLSGILTKSGVFGILVVTGNIFLHDSGWGLAVLIIGVITMVLGAVLAMFSVDLKRTLACSSMSQIGFILTGVGMTGLLGHHNALAVRGAILHMVNHSLIKLVLFMVAGVIFMNLHKLNLNDIRGFGRKKPLLHFIFLMGGLGIIGMPLWNGFVSKTLIHEAIVEYIYMFPEVTAMSTWMQVAEALFLFSGGLTAAYMTKLYICIFWERNPEHQAEYDAKKKYMNWQSATALTISACILPLLGFFPNVFMDRIATMAQTLMHGHDPAHAVNYFSAVNLKGGFTSLAIGAIVYLILIRPCLMKKEAGHKYYVDAWPKFLDLEDLVYRPLVLKIFPALGAFVARCLCDLFDGIIWLLRHSILRDAKLNPVYKKFAFDRELSAAQTTQRQILGSLTFALLIFCAGLVAALLYMLG